MQVFAFSISLLLAQKVFEHQTSEYDTDAPVSTHKKISCKKDKYKYAPKQW